MTLPLGEPASGRLTLGVRPETVRLGEAGFPARVEDLEAHGRETIYHLETPLGRLRALEAGSVARFRVGDQTRIEIPRALIFDGQGRRIGDTALLAAA